MSTCATCGAELGARERCVDLLHDLTYRTLAHPKPALFIHQYVVDAYAAQHAAENAKPITTAFALVGLYLFAEHGHTGREVQQAHMALGRTKRRWPVFDVPSDRADLTIADVLASAPGDAQDSAIERWARSVWEIWKHERASVERLLREAKVLRGT